MRITRIFARAALVGAVGVLALPGLALAQQEELQAPEDPVAPGDTFIVDGTCGGGSHEATFWYTRAGSAERIDTSSDESGNGDFAVSLTVPRDAETGQYRLAMRCEGVAHLLGEEFLVAGEDAPAPDAPAVAVSPPTVNPGSTIAVSGTCAGDTNDGAIWFSPADGPPRPYARDQGLAADSHGRVTGTLSLPTTTEPGGYLAWLRCGDAAAGSTSFTVASGGSTAGDGGSMGGTGTSLLLAGSGMLSVAAVAGAIYLQRRVLDAPR